MPSMTGNDNMKKEKPPGRPAIPLGPRGFPLTDSRIARENYEKHNDGKVLPTWELGLSPPPPGSAAFMAASRGQSHAYPPAQGFNAYGGAGSGAVGPVGTSGGVSTYGGNVGTGGNSTASTSGRSGIAGTYNGIRTSGGTASIASIAGARGSDHAYGDLSFIGSSLRSGRIGHYGSGDTYRTSGNDVSWNQPPSGSGYRATTPLCPDPNSDGEMSNSRTPKVVLPPQDQRTLAPQTSDKFGQNPTAPPQSLYMPRFIPGPRRDVPRPAVTVNDQSFNAPHFRSHKQIHALSAVAPQSPNFVQLRSQGETLQDLELRAQQRRRRAQDLLAKERGVSQREVFDGQSSLTQKGDNEHMQQIKQREMSQQTQSQKISEQMQHLQISQPTPRLPQAQHSQLAQQQKQGPSRSPSPFELPPLSEAHRLQRIRDEKMKSFDSDDDDEFYPHND
ncbi:uncharacterized protein GGS25DRAFT_529998 [Hypoxylon fragiforme]|uniref:uncharacterized protein n=1 Tax=Hypoxylon fragiforme TaxID=63214 RepID=UPI0020C694BC|nr:uncharacterized protein GGS25DRAFT_529998 [Hypoxylon fragiforme]KAI2611135.1 hypothetical protein GGS25DRAFT_529998 [Hypoxylon fragiforme]